MLYSAMKRNVLVLLIGTISGMAVMGADAPSKTVSRTKLPEAVLPFTRVSPEVLRQSPKKVFGHYFTQFPLSIDNRNPKEDYYEKHYLDPAGEDGKHRSYGGFLRQRPLPREPRAEKDWFERNLEEEVRSAIAIGLDGFACDILQYEGYHRDRVGMLLDAASRVDSDFKIMLMPDMEAAFKSEPEKLVGCIRELARHPAVFRLDDGKAVVSPFNAQNQTAAWWKDWGSEMERGGMDIALVPLFQDWKRFAEDFKPISYGFSDWGWRHALGHEKWIKTAREAHEYVQIWMAPVAPQDMRPRSLSYWESANSENFRTMWENAIEGGADWAHLITWNDYSEHSVIAPSTGTQHAFYDLTAYYTAWFKTGKQPMITRDVLYYFHRLQSTSARPDLTRQTGTFEIRPPGYSEALDEIELLAFLTSPGTLQIEIAGQKHEMEAPAGISSFCVPLSTGRPEFGLLRGGKQAVSVRSAFAISDRIMYQNLLYHGGSSSRSPIADSSAR